AAPRSLQPPGRARAGAPPRGGTRTRRRAPCRNQGRQARGTGRTMSTTAQQGRFTLVLPPGWSRIPLGSGSRAAVRAVVDRAVAGLDDRRAVDVRRRLQQLLSEQVQAAQAQSGIELYLPTEPVHGISVPASVVVSLPPVGADADPM